MQPEKKQLLIRADAGTDIGTGHFMRCLALGQAWKDAGGKVIFIETPAGYPSACWREESGSP